MKRGVIRSMNKRGLSTVVETVLIILVTVIAVSIIISIIIPFVRDKLSSSKECYDVLGDVSISESPYLCYVATGEGRTGISVRIDNENIGGFRISMIGEGAGDAYDIKNGTLNENVRMLGGAFNSALSLPQNGGVRTYVFKKDFTKAEIYPILKNGKKCDLADEAFIKACEDAAVIGNITTSP